MEGRERGGREEGVGGGIYRRVGERQGLDKEEEFMCVWGGGESVGK